VNVPVSGRESLNGAAPNLHAISWKSLSSMHKIRASEESLQFHGTLFASGHQGPTVDTLEQEYGSLVPVLSVV